MGKYRWHPSFVEDYAKLKSRINREYGERSYNDKFRVESSGMLRQNEPDYEIHFKPYKPEKTNVETTSAWDSPERLETPSTEQQEKIEPAERSENLQPSLEYQNIEQLLENDIQKTENPIENELLQAEDQMKSEHILESQERSGELVSDKDITQREKLRKLGHGDYAVEDHY